MQPMYPGQQNSPQTELATAIDDTQDTIEVLNGSVLPDAPNLAVIGAGELAETVRYGSKDGNVLREVERGFQGTAQSWQEGTKIARNFTAYDYDALRTNVEGIQNELENLDLSAENVTLDSPDFQSTNVKDGMQELFTNVVNGKNEIAGAINDMNQPANGSDPFSDLAQKIRDISSDATATAGDILAGKTAYARGEKIIGALEMNLPPITDWSAYSPRVDWTATPINLPGSSWGTVVNTTGEGYLVFVRAATSTYRFCPNIRITIDDQSIIFSGTTTNRGGNMILQPIYFKTSLKIEIQNIDAVWAGFRCDYTYLIKTRETSNEQIITKGIRRMELSITNSENLVDAVSVDGAGYLLGIYQSVQTGIGTVAYEDMVNLYVQRDNGILRNDRETLGISETLRRDNLFVGPIRFNNSLTVKHRTTTGRLNSVLYVWYTLD